MLGLARESSVVTVFPTSVIGGPLHLSALLWPTSIAGLAVLWVGTLYAIYRGFTTKDRRTAKLTLTMPGILLGALASGCAGRGAPTPPLSDTEAVAVVWTFEQVERGAIISSPRVAGDRVYVAAIRELACRPPAPFTA